MLVLWRYGQDDPVACELWALFLVSCMADAVQRSN